MPRIAVAVTFASVLVIAGPTHARADEPSNGALIGAGIGMALPTYALGVSVHEGSHALAAELVGAHVVDMNLLPHVYRGHFYFGRVQVLGLTSRAQRTFFLIAPKITDSVLLGAYAASFYGGVLPDNKYGLLAFTVLATGFWVDFTRDVLAFWDHNDTVKIYNAYGLDTEWKRLPARIIHAGLAVAGAIAIVHGYQQIFDSSGDARGAVAARQPATLLPLLTTSF